MFISLFSRNVKKKSIFVLKLFPIHNIRLLVGNTASAQWVEPQTSIDVVQDLTSQHRQIPEDSF